MHFKSLLTSVAISALFGYMPAANAADVVKHHPHHVKHIAPAAPVIIAPSAPVFSWAGPYLGIETGVVMTKFHAPRVNDEITGGIIQPNQQPAAGLFAGYNFAIAPHIIMGLDGNIDYHAVTSPNSEHDAYTKYKEDALAAARIRLGLAQGRVLPYIAGGLSVARAGLNRVESAAPGVPVLRESNKKSTYLGWNVGGGLDCAVANNMLLRLDYRFSQVKVKDAYAIIAGDLVHQNINTNVRSHEIRVGAAYKF